MRTLIHPLIVHFPIALWLTSALFDVFFLRGGERFYFRASQILIGVGLVGAVASVISGYYDYIPLVAEGVGQAFVDRHKVHQASSLAATAVYAASFLIRWRRPQVTRGWLVGLLVVGAALTALTGWLGGELRLVM
ncbi:MAG: DUF2231 domain-containing protein [Armatimonadota bacterium]|nr:DUF2231 domain-containing protein [Armatimonadota bacterium]MDR7518941.1 DUF2231 domain-containing protein [Armatimonadota bacterium]